MSDRQNSIAPEQPPPKGDPWNRIEASLARLDALATRPVVRRTAAEAGDESALVQQLRDENASLAARVAELEAREGERRRRAAELLGSVDRALEQLDLAGGG
ncbi:MAG: hypothetical protein VYB54_10755 [Pseudomonadota bacterium]|nr:hypothetical protein [Pseudomonadota bacterium]